MVLILVTLCLEYKPDGIRCRCFKDREKQLRRQGKIKDVGPRMLPGERSWSGWRYITNELHNPCMDITCANNHCYDHPHMYDHTGVKPCKTPNCGYLNCKRWPCDYDGNDLGLGKWPTNQLYVFPMECWILIKSIIPKFVIIIFIREKVIILFVWKEAILLWRLLFKQRPCDSPPLIIFFGRWKWN